MPSPLQRLEAGAEAAYVCACCGDVRRVGLYADNAVHGAELASQLLAYYGSPPVCPACQERQGRS
jgi:hypothetical protein